MKNKRLEEILSTYKVYIDTCSLMERSNGFFEFELVPLLQKFHKKIYVISNVKQELLKLKNIASKSSDAIIGLNNLAFLEENNVIELEETENSMHADGAFFEVLYYYRRKCDVCLITEDKDLALTVLTNLKHISCVNFSYDIEAIKLNSGNPMLWTLEMLDKKLGVSEITEYKFMQETIVKKTHNY